MPIFTENNLMRQGINLQWMIIFLELTCLMLHHSISLMTGFTKNFRNFLNLF